MDEPTSALTRKEVDKLFRVIRQLQGEGISVLFVSHKLDEVFEIADQFTVFRNGRHIVSDSARNIDNDQFIYYMTGRKIEQDYFDPKDVDYNRSLFRVENLCLKNGFENISFDIHPGEILGITGLLGSGQDGACEGFIRPLQGGQRENLCGGQGSFDKVPDGCAPPEDSLCAWKTA